MSFRVVIPARYGSTRLPGKPLRILAGKPMIQHVHARALEAGAAQVIIATDDERVRDAAQGFGAEVCMTSPQHRSGTDRLAEVAETRGYAPEEIIVNVQGDEPLIDPAAIRQVADNLAAHRAASIATLCEPLHDSAAVFDPNVVKVVFDAKGYALYFSRAPIPWDRDHYAAGGKTPGPGAEYFRHIGLYAYRCAFLHEYLTWAPCVIERTESLEQLRALWHGHRIHVAPALATSVAGVDTEQDVARVEALLRVRG